MASKDTLGETGIKGFSSLLQNERVESTFNPLIYMNSEIKPSTDKDKQTPVGRQIQTSPIRSGRMDRGGVLFERDYVPLNATPGGSGYNATYELQKQKEMESSKQMTTNWKPSNPGKKPTGRGSQYGLLEKWPEHMADPKKPLTKDDVQHEKMPMYTSPGKKGHYGYPKLGIGPDPTYSSEATAPHARADVDAKKEEETKRRAGTKPFVTMDYGMRGPSLDVYQPQPQEPKPTPRVAGQSKERIDKLEHYAPFKAGTMMKGLLKTAAYEEEGDRRSTRKGPPIEKAWKYPGPGGVCPAQYSIQKYGLYSRTIFERSFKPSHGSV